MHALFVTNQHKTEFYSAVAGRMRDQGAAISWISVSERWTRYLIEQSWSAAAILSLPRFGEEWSQPLALTAADRARVARLELAGETSLKNILIMDRELNKQPGATTEAYAAVVSREIERFVVARGVTHGFGEPTWAPEMIASEVLRAHGCGYYMHHTLRIPSARFGFYRGIFHNDLAHIATPTDAHRTMAHDVMRAVRTRGERPYYFARNMNPQRFRAHWVDEAVAAVVRPEEARFDHTVPGLATRSVRRIRARYRAEQTQRANLFERAPADGHDRPFLLIMLHKQPESSVDVFGNGRNNQLELVRALTRLMPFEWEVWVKEHGHALGDRSRAYYRELKALPGVRLIDPAEDTMALIRRAGLVGSVAGTGCMEAGVLGIPAFTFARMFFSPILLADDVDPFALDPAAMRALLNRAAAWRADTAKDASIAAFLADIIAQSFEGLISDPLSDPACLEAANIERVAAATLALMRAPGS